MGGRERKESEYLGVTPHVLSFIGRAALSRKYTKADPKVLVFLAELRGNSLRVATYLSHSGLERFVGGNVQLGVRNLLRVKDHFNFLLMLLDLRQKETNGIKETPFQSARPLTSKLLDTEE